MSVHLTVDPESGYWSQDIFLWAHISGCIPIWGSRSLAEYPGTHPEVREPTREVVEENLKSALQLAMQGHSDADCVCQMLSTMIALDSNHCSFENIHPSLVSDSYKRTILLRDPKIELGKRTYRVGAVFAKLPVAGSAPYDRLYGHLQHARIIDIPSLKLVVETNGKLIKPNVPQADSVFLLHDDVQVSGKQWGGKQLHVEPDCHKHYQIVDSALLWAFENCKATLPSRVTLLDRIESKSGDIYPQFRTIVNSLYQNILEPQDFRELVQSYRVRLWDAPGFFELVQPSITEWISEQVDRISDPGLTRASSDPESLDDDEFRHLKPRRTLIEVIEPSVAGKIRALIPSFSEEQVVELPEEPFIALGVPLSRGMTLIGSVNFGAEKSEDLFCTNLEVAPQIDDDPS